MSEPTVEAVTYEVNAYTRRDINRDLFTIKVERRGDDSWAVIYRSGCWNRRTRAWDYEPLPSSRTDAYKRTHRFPLEQAFDIARNQAQHVTCMGLTAAEAMEQWAPEPVS